MAATVLALLSCARVSALASYCIATAHVRAARSSDAHRARGASCRRRKKAVVSRDRDIDRDVICLVFDRENTIRARVASKTKLIFGQGRVP